MGGKVWVVDVENSLAEESDAMRYPSKPRGGRDDMLNLESESLPAGSEGLVILPYLGGERTPIWDTDSRGDFSLNLC